MPERHISPDRSLTRWMGLCALLLAIGCTPGEDAGHAGPERPENEPSLRPDADAPPAMELPPMNDPAAGSTSADPLAKATEAARRDLAERVQAESDAIEVVERRLVTWRNGAMGCPEPDMMYTQALVPGVWIRLRHGERQYDYHGARNGTPFLCPAERAEAPLPPDDDPLA